MRIVRGTFAHTRQPTAGQRAKVVALGGDGIGPEVVAAALRCVRALDLPIDIAEPLHGSAAVAAGEDPFSPEVRDMCEQADAVLFGACERVSIPILHFLRFDLDSYANLRPARSIPDIGVGSRDRFVDLVVVRELTEGLYPGREGELSELSRRWPEFRDRLDRPLPDHGYFAIGVVTEPATRRIGRYAADLAARRKAEGISAGKVTVVTKANVMPTAEGAFRRWCEEEIASVGGLEVDHLYIDEAARRAAACPETFDVVVSGNLFGDILSDVASEAGGGLPLAPSASVGERHAYFEPVHGSAPDIVGKGVANPVAAMVSAAMMLGYLGHLDAAERLEDAITASVKSGSRTADMGGDATTEQVTDAVCKHLSRGA
jgi:isocitrate/isopropylmalate dehydrogenase